MLVESCLASFWQFPFYYYYYKGASSDHVALIDSLCKIVVFETFSNNNNNNNLLLGSSSTRSGLHRGSLVSKIRYFFDNFFPQNDRESRFAFCVLMCTLNFSPTGQHF